MYTFSNCGLSINFLHLVKLKNNQVYGYNCTTMSKLITVLLAESALETFPKELLSGLEVRQFFSKLKKTPSEVMFDMGYHSNFTKGLTDIEKRGSKTWHGINGSNQTLPRYPCRLSWQYCI